MNRRRFLALTSTTLTALTGCTAPTQSSNSDPPTTTTGSPPPTVSLTAQDATGPTHGIDLSARVSESTVTDAHTASITLAITNTSSNTRTVRSGDGGYLFLTNRTSHETDPGIVLVAPAQEPSSPPTTTDRQVCWKLSEMPTSPYLVAKSLVLDPQETRETTLHVWGHPENTSCLPAGSYQFKDAYHVETRDSQSTRSFRWGFTLHISRPD